MTGVSFHNKLPIDAHCDHVCSTLSNTKLQLLVAAPGTGKSTRIPPLLAKKIGKTILIQPRRAAAKMLAHRIAQEWGCTVGHEVGYQIRFDASYTKQTKLLVATEGIVRQRMLSDPFLEEFSVIILDEVHERSLNGDMLLGWFKELRSLRDDVHILLLSATINPSRYIDFFDAQLHVYHVEGRTFPVQIHYEEHVSNLSFQERLSKTIQQARAHIQPQESILVFLPGRRDIEQAIERNQYSSHISLPLYSSLPFAQQMRLFEDFPKIVFSTNVAESSITLPNIGAVIDSGLEKISIDKGGFGQLKTVDIAQESADQRAGRAGRTQRGYCFRMWRSSAHRRSHRRAEIEHSDLMQAFLHILDWGITIDDFSWLTPPSTQRKEHTVEQLKTLSLLDDGGITPKGKEIARIPVHPRIGTVLQKSYELGVFHPCAQLATLLLHDQTIHPHRWKESCQTIQQHHTTRRIYHQLIRYFPKTTSTWNNTSIAQAWVCGYRDRIAQHVPEDKSYLLSDGGRARSTYTYPWFLALQLHQHERHMRTIAGGIPLELSQISQHVRIVHRWKVNRVEAIQEHCIGAIVLRTQNCPVNRNIAEKILCAHAHQKEAFTHTKASTALFQRMQYCTTIMPFPDLSSLLPFLCKGKRSFSELQSISLYDVIEEQLTWKQKQCLLKHAPTHFQTPSNARVPIDYHQDPPIIRARIQQLFGLNIHPQIGNKPVTIELLAPNNRAQQRTQDIHGFWSGSYTMVRKDLRGRYPKHAWPERPTKKDAENRPSRKKN